MNKPTTPETWIDEARQIAAQAWCTPETESTVMDAALAEVFARIVANWMDIAAGYARSVDYYRDLLVECGESIGQEAFTCDDGSTSEDVLCAKIPELVKKLVGESPTPHLNDLQPTPTDMTKEELIQQSKTFRRDLDEVLQRMKAHRTNFTPAVATDFEGTASEVAANHILSIRDLESAIMRQGMVLKNIGAPNPYPQSKNPDSPDVEPTADGLKL